MHNIITVRKQNLIVHLIRIVKKLRWLLVMGILLGCFGALVAFWVAIGTLLQGEASYSEEYYQTGRNFKPVNLCRICVAIGMLYYSWVPCKWVYQHRLLGLIVPCAYFQEGSTLLEFFLRCRVTCSACCGPAPANIHATAGTWEPVAGKSSGNKAEDFRDTKSIVSYV